jgi:DNA-binding NarL/FixJ family response regulator
MEHSRSLWYLLMPMHDQSAVLDDRSLAGLRRCLLTLRRQTNGTLPIDQLVKLARDVAVPVGVTIDFRASEQLGAPLVVVRIAEAERTAHKLNGLSRRESQVCGLIAEGRSNKEIATRLCITLATVKDHVHKILRKTGLPNRAAVAAGYREAKLTSDRNSLSQR